MRADPMSLPVGGYLRSAVEEGRSLPIEWVEIAVDDLQISVSTDALMATVEGFALRLPVSYTDHVAICKELGCIPPTVAISDAIYRQAKIRIVPRPLSHDGDIMSLGYSIRHNQNIGEHPAGVLVADVGKDWILHERLNERGAVNYGWRMRGGIPWQKVGGVHNATHYDYSQVLRLVKRFARGPNGDVVDLLVVIDEQTNHQITRFLDALV